jgi:hypothetical protein
MLPLSINAAVSKHIPLNLSGSAEKHVKGNSGNDE